MKFFNRIVMTGIGLLPVINTAAESSVDSLKSVIETAMHLRNSPARDTSICRAYLDWGEQVYLSNPDTALILWQRAKVIARKNLKANQLTVILKKKYLSSLADALNNIGAIYNYKGNIAKGLEYYFSSLKIQKELGIQEEIATCLNNIGFTYNSFGNIAKGLEYYHKSLKLYEEAGDKSGEATSLNNIGYVYKSQGDIAKGLEYYQKSLKISEEIGDKEGVATCLNNIGVTYNNQGDEKKGLEYYQKSLKLYEEIGHKYGAASAMNNIGSIYRDQGNTQKALEYYQKSLKIEEELEDIIGVASSFHNIGAIFLYMGDIALAKKYAQKSMKLAAELGFPDDIKRPANLLSEIDRKEGNYKQALEMYELFIQMRDSINNEQTQKATIRQQTKYEFEKAQLVKEQEERELARIESEKTSRRDNLQYSVIVIVIVIVFSLILFLTRVNISVRLLEGLIFFSFLIFFEFLLVLADPYIDNWSGGAPGIKLLFNAAVAALIFPLHSLFESKLKNRLIKAKHKS